MNPYRVASPRVDVKPERSLRRHARIALCRAAIALWLALSPRKARQRCVAREEAAYRRALHRYRVCEIPEWEGLMAVWREAFIRRGDTALLRMMCPTRPLEPQPPLSRYDGDYE